MYFENGTIFIYTGWIAPLYQYIVDNPISYLWIYLTICYLIMAYIIRFKKQWIYDLTNIREHNNLNDRVVVFGLFFIIAPMTAPIFSFMKIMNIKE